MKKLALILFSSWLLLAGTGCEKEGQVLINPADVTGIWRHSVEEDTMLGTQIWRPDDFHTEWPLTRGREVMELQASGSATYFSIAPNDAGHMPYEATWTTDGPIIQLKTSKMEDMAAFEFSEDTKGKKLIRL